MELNKNAAALIIPTNWDVYSLDHLIKGRSKKIS